MAPEIAERAAQLREVYEAEMYMAHHPLQGRNGEDGHVTRGRVEVCANMLLESFTILESREVSPER